MSTSRCNASLLARSAAVSSASAPSLFLMNAAMASRTLSGSSSPFSGSRDRSPMTPLICASSSGSVLASLPAKLANPVARVNFSTRPRRRDSRPAAVRNDPLNLLA